MLEHDSQEYENPAMQHDKIKPILFSVIKHSSKEELKKQLPKDIVSGIVVAVVALPLSIALAIASGVGPEAGLYTKSIIDGSKGCSGTRDLNTPSWEEVVFRSRVPLQPLLPSLLAS